MPYCRTTITAAERLAAATGFAAAPAEPGAPPSSPPARARSEPDLVRAALDAARVGTWSFDVASNRFTWDQGYHDLYGFGEHEPASFDAWMERVHPADRPRLQQAIAALVAQGGSDTWDQEFRAHHPTKGLRLMLGLGRVARDSEGRAIRFAGINVDVTDRPAQRADSGAPPSRRGPPRAETAAGVIDIGLAELALRIQKARARSPAGTLALLDDCLARLQKLSEHLADLGEATGGE